MKSKFHAANEKPQHALMRGPSFYFFWRGRPGIFKFFFPCSQCVPIVLPWVPISLPNDYSSSQVVAQDVANSTSDVLDFSPFLCSQCVLIMFLSFINEFSTCSPSSQCVPQHGPNNTWRYPISFALSSSRSDLYYRAQKGETTINHLFWDCPKLD